jgi:hypothetical protein
VGGHLDPVALVLGAGSKLITNPLTSPFFPGVTGLPSRSRGREGTPASTADSACFQHVTAGLPHRVRCLAAAQAGQQAKSNGEACTLANSGCLIACLTARTVTRGATGGATRAFAHPTRTGRLPRYRAGQRPLPDGSTGVGPPLPTERRQAEPSTPETHLFGNT